MLYAAAIVLHLTFLIGVSVYTPDDFMVAGRRVSAWFLAGTLVCTWMGSGSLFGGGWPPSSPRLSLKASWTWLSTRTPSWETQ